MKDFWYCRFIIARNKAEAIQKATRGEYQKMLFDTGANHNLTTPKYDQFLTNKTKSMLSARAAFGNKVTPRSCSCELHLWIVDGGNDHDVNMAFAGMTLSEFMQNALVMLALPL